MKLVANTWLPWLSDCLEIKDQVYFLTVNSTFERMYLVYGHHRVGGVILLHSAYFKMNRFCTFNEKPVT